MQEHIRLRGRTFVLAMEQAIITVAVLRISVISIRLPITMLPSKTGTIIKMITNNLGAARIIIMAIIVDAVVIRMAIVTVVVITEANLTKALRMGANDRALHQRKS